MEFEKPILSMNRKLKTLIFTFLNYQLFTYYKINIKNSGINLVQSLLCIINLGPFFNKPPQFLHIFNHFQQTQMRRFPFSDRKFSIHLFTHSFNYTNYHSTMTELKQPNYFKPDQSLLSLEYTYAFSKYSCISWVYPFHIAFAYLVVLSGFLALISRVITPLTPYHVAFGRWYLIFMFWCMASSLLIHNTGLPFPIIISFLYLLVSITIGWNAIKIYMSRFSDQLTVKMNERINLLVGKPQPAIIDIKTIENEERQLLITQKSFSQRFFSLRMLHGLLFAFSWAQMIGRVFVTNPGTSFHGCWTYPAYKPMSPTLNVYPLDSQSTPAFPMKEGLFIAVITAPTVLIILAVACLTTFCFYKSDSKMKEVSPQSSDIITN